ncbi:MAG: DUF1905 domain-containing protein [Pseudomonadales bacterium]|nr:DUF1905 domain-containing protein [Candidatus Woesebacteria bacterium]MCB9801448.1 DUF1905 domain-containing protein [Pseudomonadales bacterium]
MHKEYQFTEKIWLYPGKAAWHFVSVPQNETADIHYHFEHAKRGWGSLKVKVTIGNTIWNTSIFPDKKTNTFLLPIKKAVRDAENLEAGQKVVVLLVVLE